MSAELIWLKTGDDVEIAGEWYSASAELSSAEGETCALLLHMMPATKESWRDLALRLNEKGISCLAIDLRGHGESNMEGRLNYRSFTDPDHQAKRLDVEAAFAWMKTKGIVEEKTIVIGASIGANLALRFQAEHEKIPLTLALSPGLNYRGITTLDAVPAIRGRQSAVLVASDDDAESLVSVRQLHKLNPTNTVLLERHGVGHGTMMIEKDEALLADLISRCSRV